MVAKPDAEVEASSGDLVEGGDVVGNVHGIEEGEEHDLDGEAQVAGDRGEAGDEGSGLHAAGEGGLVGVAEDGEGEASLLHGVEEALGLVDPLAEGAGLAGRATHEGHEDGA